MTMRTLGETELKAMGMLGEWRPPEPGLIWECVEHGDKFPDGERCPTCWKKKLAESPAGGAWQCNQCRRSIDTPTRCGHTRTHEAHDGSAESAAGIAARFADWAAQKEEEAKRYRARAEHWHRRAQIKNGPTPEDQL